MKLASANPIIDFNLDSILATEVSTYFSLVEKYYVSIYLSLVAGGVL